MGYRLSILKQKVGDVEHGVLGSNLILTLYFNYIECISNSRVVVYKDDSECVTN